jgi:CheY-like chemotaxis protein
MTGVGRKVLLGEDGHDQRTLLIRALHAVGFDPATVGAAEEGLALPEEEQQYGLATVDMRLPGMRGLEALSTFKTKWPELPLSAMTAGRNTTGFLVQTHGASGIIYSRHGGCWRRERRALEAEGEGEPAGGAHPRL